MRKNHTINYSIFALLLLSTVNTIASDQPFLGRAGSEKRERSDVTASPIDTQKPPAQPKADAHKTQVYGIATYDALFKYVLSQESVQASFFHTFLPNIPIKSIKRLDEHMNPVKSFQTLRDTFTGIDVKNTVASLKKAKAVSVQTQKKAKDVLEENVDGTAFLTSVVKHFDDFQRLIPKPEYDGTMDFVCELDSGEFALVEMQVIPKDYWDKRALAYVAAFYGNQLRQGDSWHDLRKVIGINILGGGKDALKHWGEKPAQFIRHYRVQEQKHQPSRFIDGIEIIQYSLMNAPQTFDERELEDWITFFKDGSKMTEDDVKSKIKTQAVLEAFKFSRMTTLPEKVKREYEAEEDRYNQYSHHTNEKIAEGKAEGKIEAKIEMVKKMITQGMDSTVIASISEISPKQIEEIRAGLK